MIQISSVAESLIASFIFVGLQLTLLFLKNKTLNWSISAIIWLSIFVLLYEVGVGGYFLISGITSIQIFAAAILPPLAFYLIYITIFLRQISSTGITRIDSETAKGFGYSNALRSTENGFNFLGTGAAKLTGVPNDEFKSMVSRVSRAGGKVKLLLCDPREMALTIMEQRAGVNTGEFQNRVKHSLVIIKDLLSRYSDVELRFYSGTNTDKLPPFRLVFINGNTCLVSFTVIGDREMGTMFPQIHFRKTYDRGAGTPSFYTPYERYFNSIWISSKKISPELLHEVIREL